jgi:hypothetical protein
MPHAAPVRTRKPMSPELLRLQAEARYARERYQLYKARVYGARVAEPKRLAELERTCLRAEGTFRRAMSAARTG